MLCVMGVKSPEGGRRELDLLFGPASVSPSAMADIKLLHNQPRGGSCDHRGPGERRCVSMICTRRGRLRGAQPSSPLSPPSSPALNLFQHQGLF